MASAKRIRLKKNDICVRCGCFLGSGVDGWWDAKARTVTCPLCRALEAEPVEPAMKPGAAGASALREYERRRSRREERTRAKHPVIGGALLFLQGAPQHEVAFRTGAAGERAVASYLEKRLADTPVVLMHDRRMPRGRGNIDHLAVAPSGVYIIDAKNLEGKVRVDAPLRGAKKLIVKGRDRTKLIDGLDRQVTAIDDVLAGHPASGVGSVPVHGVLCFVRAELPLFGTPQIRGHQLLGRRGTVKRLTAHGPLDAGSIRRLAERLAATFPAA